ncbi:MAG: hypothetical protein WED34_04775 [Planctomycetales bacterium]
MDAKDVIGLMSPLTLASFIADLDIIDPTEDEKITSVVEWLRLAKIARKALIVNVGDEEAERMIEEMRAGET